MHCLTDLDDLAVITVDSSDDTKLLGGIIGLQCYPGLTLLLYGGLGAGKTLLTQGIGFALGYKNIKSPTFIILAEHEGILPLVHADLYRLDSYTEADSLDLENYIEDGYLLVVEWADNWKNPPLNDRLDITIESIASDVNIRKITMRAFCDRSKKLLNGIVDLLPKS